MHHNGGGVIAIAACGSDASVCTEPVIHAMIQPLRFAKSWATGENHAKSSCSAPRSIVVGTHGTTARFANTAYVENWRNVDAVTGHVPSWVATVRTSASRTARGSDA